MKEEIKTEKKWKWPGKTRSMEEKIKGEKVAMYQRVVKRAHDSIILQPYMGETRKGPKLPVLALGNCMNVALSIMDVDNEKDVEIDKDLQNDF